MQFGHVQGEVQVEQPVQEATLVVFEETVRENHVCISCVYVIYTHTRVYIYI